MTCWKTPATTSDPELVSIADSEEMGFAAEASSGTEVVAHSHPYANTGGQCGSWVE